MKRMIVRTQHVSRMCFACGVENATGLHARFFELEGAELLGIFEPRDEHQGYPGRLHGGIATTILDETIGRAIGLFDPGAFGVTIDLSVRFRAPVPTDRPVHAIGRITKPSERLFEGAGEIVLDDGTVAVEATGRFLKMGVDKIADGELDGEWFADERDAPGSIDLPGTERQ